MAGQHRPQGSKMNPKSLANLKPAKKGEVRNPTGKKGPTGLRAFLRYELETRAPDKVWAALQAQGFAKGKDAKGVNAKAIAKILTIKALQGNLTAIKMITDITELPLKQEVELTGADGGPLQIEVSSSLDAKLAEILCARKT